MSRPGCWSRILEVFVRTREGGRRGPTGQIVLSPCSETMVCNSICTSGLQDHSRSTPFAQIKNKKVLFTSVPAAETGKLRHGVWTAICILAPGPAADRENVNNASHYYTSPGAFEVPTPTLLEMPTPISMFLELCWVCPLFCLCDRYTKVLQKFVYKTSTLKKGYWLKCIENGERH